MLVDLNQNFWDCEKRCLISRWLAPEGAISYPYMKSELTFIVTEGSKEQVHYTWTAKQEDQTGGFQV